MAVEIVRGNEEEGARPVTRDEKDRNLRMRDRDIIPVSEGLKALQYTITEGTDNTPHINAYTTP